MGLSSNSILHFTNDKNALKSILKNNFRVFYCRESIIIGNIPITYVAPMVSFCDIPLSEIKNQISKYGTYGIGLTKEWAERKKLNPVLYLEKQSSLSSSYLAIYKKYVIDPGVGRSQLSLEQSQVVDIMRYIKNYQNDLTRNNETFKNYRFSDEREWRYVPEFNKSFPLILPIDEYQTKKQKDIINDLVQDIRLEFDPNDIKYIIINREDEISEFLTVLRDTKGKKYSFEDVEKLMTRILTYDQIMSDF